MLYAILHMLFTIAKTSGLGTYIRRNNNDAINFQNGRWISQTNIGYTLSNSERGLSEEYKSDEQLTPDAYKVFEEFIYDEIIPHERQSRPTPKQSTKKPTQPVIEAPVLEDKKD